MLWLALLACTDPGADSGPAGDPPMPDGVTLGEVHACAAPLPDVRYS